MCTKLPIYKHDYKNEGYLACIFTGDFSDLSHCPSQQQGYILYLYILNGEIINGEIIKEIARPI